jgi:hypothetical protein
VKSEFVSMKDLQSYPPTLSPIFKPLYSLLGTTVRYGNGLDRVLLQQNSEVSFSIPAGAIQSHALISC